MLDCCIKAIEVLQTATGSWSVNLEQDSEEFEFLDKSQSSETCHMNPFDLFAASEDISCTVSKLMEYFWNQNPQKCVNIILQLRNKLITPHYSRVLPLKCMVWLREHHPETYIRTLSNFISVGYYKDLLLILDMIPKDSPKLGVRDYIELEIIAETLVLDYNALCEIVTKSGRIADHTVTMCAKWAPSEHKKWHSYATIVSKLINPNSIRHREFYRDILTRLRTYLKDSISEKQLLINIEKSNMPYASLIKYQPSFVVNNNWSKTDEQMLLCKTIKRLSTGYNIDEKYIIYIYEMFEVYSSTGRDGFGDLASPSSASRSDAARWLEGEPSDPECTEQNIKLSTIHFDPERTRQASDGLQNVQYTVHGNFKDANLKILFIMYYLFITSVGLSESSSLLINNRKIQKGISLNELIQTALDSTDDTQPAIELTLELSCSTDPKYNWIWYPLKQICITGHSDLECNTDSICNIQGMHPIIFNSIIDTNLPPTDFFSSLAEFTV